jgi:hypothetical protein
MVAQVSSTTISRHIISGTFISLNSNIHQIKGPWRFHAPGFFCAIFLVRDLDVQEVCLEIRRHRPHLLLIFGC